jgi:hypothetical protein
MKEHDSEHRGSLLSTPNPRCEMDKNVPLMKFENYYLRTIIWFFESRTLKFFLLSNLEISNPLHLKALEKYF